jgi:hypothetical protein
MDRSRRPHSFLRAFSRTGGLSVGLRASHSAVIVLHFVLHRTLISGCKDEDVSANCAALPPLRALHISTRDLIVSVDSKLFEELFEQIVLQCVEVGLVQGKR